MMLCPQKGLIEHSDNVSATPALHGRVTVPINGRADKTLEIPKMLRFYLT